MERHWEGELRIEVRNVIDTSAPETQPLVMAEPIPEHVGQGLDGHATTARGRSAGGSTYGVARSRAADVHGDRLGAGALAMTIQVLLVDDQELFREGVRVIVDAQEGMEVVGAAADGLEAVRLVDELPPTSC